MAKSRDPDRADRLNAVAEQQGGYFSATQACAAGYQSSQLAYHVCAGRYRRVRWGVYRLAQFPTTPYEDLFAAWLEVGPHSIVSHDSALVVYDLSDVLPAAVHLIVPRGASRRRRPGLRLHTNLLKPEDVTNVMGLPITTVARTITDVAIGGLSEEMVSQAAREAVRRGLVSQEGLVRYALARRGRAWRIVGEALREPSA
ncbi:MAG TPA: type IV toxin-antitoxin system AbiEi family antitoxin domain-containing protein [Armatimonadota bacterium]|nr:type IV toxin-antitoxin system AbiEi family antitoxin domain-containing protein [Armatimonadota bacterium]